jgi:hypothetical protein
MPRKATTMALCLTEEARATLSALARSRSRSATISARSARSRQASISADNRTLVAWAMRKYKHHAGHRTRASLFLESYDARHTTLALQYCAHDGAYSVC